LKLIIASLLIFSLVILFLFALFPSEISVTRVVQIRCTAPQVNKKIADLREWNWNEFLYDAFTTHFPMRYGGGRIDSNYIHLVNVSVDLVKSVPDTVVTRWQHGNKSFMGEYIISPQTNGKTILEWTLHFHIKWYPWDKLASMFYEKQLGPLMDKSLMNLQRELEERGN
jgi:Polyketide cyclase / dehydrase and lipid transport